MASAWLFGPPAASIFLQLLSQRSNCSFVIVIVFPSRLFFSKTKNPSLNKKSRECRFALLISQITLQDLAPCPCARALVGCWDVIGPVPRSLLIKKLFNFQIYYVIPLRKIQLIANSFIWFINYICSTHFLSILKKDQTIPRCWSFLLSDHQHGNSRINYSQYT